MLYVQSAEPDLRLKPFISRYVQRELNPCQAEVIEPVIARLGTMLEFLFANPYFIPTYGNETPRYCPLITVIGPITARRVRLEIHGPVEALVVLFHPLGLYRFFRTLMSYLAEGGTEGHSVLGPSLSSLYEHLGNTPGFLQRKELLNAFFFDRLSHNPPLDPRGKALRLLMPCTMPASVSEAASQAGISTRQLERISLQYAGATPKVLGKVARFERALRLKFQHGWTWTRIAQECHYHDQMHMIRDFRELAGSTPGRAGAEVAPEHLINYF